MWQKARAILGEWSGRELWVRAQRPKPTLCRTIPGQRNAGEIAVDLVYETNILFCCNDGIERNLAVTPDRLELLPDFKEHVDLISFEQWRDAEFPLHGGEQR